jgi:D-glycero-alpha-D-manno-heptose 1-phosphate guanylyltransferase
VILSVRYLYEKILDRIPQNYSGLEIRFVREENPLGTGSAIRYALQHSEEPSVLVMNGDTYVDVGYTAMHKKHTQIGSVMTRAVTSVADTARYGGVVVGKDRVVGFIEKGKTGQGWINAGSYVLKRDFPWPGTLPSRFSFEEHVLAPRLASLQPAAFCHTGFFLDIGVPEDLDRAQTKLPRMH